MLFLNRLLFIAPYLLTKSDGEEKTRFPSTFHEKDFSVTKLKDTNLANAHPEEDEKPDEVDWEKECQKFSKKEMDEIIKTYKSDPGRIEHVSADALKGGSEDMKKIECLKRGLKKNNQEAYLTTTFDLNEVVNASKKKVHRSQKRRGNEYQFETIEYYDDVINFDSKQCPDAVDVINLEILDLKPYDIECELLCEWTSLE